MKPCTIATLEELRNATFFSSVGVRESEHVDYASSWGEAISLCGSQEWEDLCQEAVDQYFARITELAPSRASEWNTVVADLKKYTVPLVAEKVKPVSSANGLPKVFVDVVQWDILHLCMESEYSDVYQVGFYASQAFWYLKGHFPCGWNGKFPQGKLIIY